MLDPNGPAFPVPPPAILTNDNWAEPSPGISVRAHFAAMAMQGIMANTHCCHTPAGVALEAVATADALIAELNKKPEAKP